MRTADANSRKVRVQSAAASRSASAACSAAQRSARLLPRLWCCAGTSGSCCGRWGLSGRAHRWMAALAHAADARLRAPAGEALHAHSLRRCDGAAPGRCGDWTGAAQAARALRGRYRRCSGTAGGAAATTAQRCAGSKQWCDVSTPSTHVRVLPSRYSECSTCVREYSFCRAPPGRARRGCASRHGRVRRHRVPRRRACRGRRLQRTTL